MKGFRLAICSNLASPYALPILDLLPVKLDAYAWSFEIGAVKPEPAIYQAVCESPGLQTEEILMVGDTAPHALSMKTFVPCRILGIQASGHRSI